MTDARTGTQESREAAVAALADTLHAKVCGPFATIDPQQCIGTRERDERLAAAILDALTPEQKAALAAWLVPQRPSVFDDHEQCPDLHCYPESPRHVRAQELVR